MFLKMKRLLYLMIIFILLLSLSGCSSKKTEKFVLRNDIHFGDSIEEVKKKESLKLKEEEVDEDDKTITKISSEEGTIANIDDSTLSYRFKDGSLYELTYYFDGPTTDSNTPTELAEVKSYITDQYDTINSSLTEKYGEPLSDEEEEQYAFRTDIYESSDSYEEMAAWGLDCELVAMDERLVECDDGSHVSIDSKAAYVGNQKGTISYIMVAYMLIPEKEWNIAKSTASEKQENLNKDL